MGKRIVVLLLVSVFVIGSASAQFGGVVYDPTNYANALLRYNQLVQQLIQLRQTYQQIVTTYNLALQMSRNLQNMPARYQALFSQWRNGAALDAFGNTGEWIAGVNTGDVGDGYQLATTQLLPYSAQQLGGMDPMELSRVHSQYASVELADGANVTAMTTIGAIRDNAANLQVQIANLQNDSLSDDPDLNTEVSVLNKINAANVLTLQSVQDSNKLLASLLEQQLITSKQQREMTANRIDTDITRQATLAANMNQLTGTLADSLQNFRMP